jgi:hypothetical protein
MLAHNVLQFDAKKKMRGLLCGVIAQELHDPRLLLFQRSLVRFCMLLHRLHHPSKVSSSFFLLPLDAGT